MKRVILDVPFSDCEYYPCDRVAVDALLGFYGYPMPLVLHDEWGFLYQRPKNGDVRVVCRFTSLLQGLQRCGISVAEHQESNGDIAWANARARIQHGHPVAAMADTYHLEKHYYPGLGHHSRHYIILAGYDDEAETVHVVDPSWIVRFRGNLSLHALGEAWGSQAIAPYKWVDCRFSKLQWTLSPKEAIQTVRQNVEMMLQKQADECGRFTGIHGMRMLAADLIRWKHLESDVPRSLLGQLFNQLRSVVIERDGHSRFLELSAAIVKDPRFVQAGDELKTITQKWLVFRNLCLKGQKKALTPILDKLHGRLLEIAALEENALARLERIVSSSATVG